MPLRMIDWHCQGRCGRRWEELTSVTSSGDALAPRCCNELAKRLPAAPAIRTNDNGPRDQRLVTTAGHPVNGQTVHGDSIWDAQLGKATEGMSAREIQRYCEQRGIEIEAPTAYLPKHLSEEPPPPRLEDDPSAMREHVDECSDMYDRWEAGALPPIETPLLDEDAEARAAVEKMTRGAAAADTVAMAADEGA